LEFYLEGKMKIKILLFIVASLTLSAVGQAPASKYQTVRKMNDLADKKVYFRTLSPADKVNVWRDHYAYIFLTEDLDKDQKEYLVRSIEEFAAGHLTDELDAEAKDLFPFELGQRVFNLGPSTDAGKTCVGPLSRLIYPNVFASPQRLPPPTDCNCRQTGTNWSCSGHCDASSCTHTPDGCSIFYMYPCDGTCSGSTRGE
jgi:hypothetical protein